MNSRDIRNFSECWNVVRYLYYVECIGLSGSEIVAFSSSFYRPSAGGVEEALALRL